MPLSKARDRERKRLERAVQPIVQPRHTIAGLEIEGNRIVGLTNKVVQPTKTIPIYNPAIHRAGDTVRMWRDRKLVQTTIPELDADGCPMPDYDR